jgi:hypothetical protein
MITAPRIIGNHVHYFRDGDPFTVPANGLAGRNAKPAAADPAWIDFGLINNLEVDHERTEVEIYAPTPGQLRLYDVLETKRKLTIKFECDELSALAFELAFGTAALTALTANYNPLAGAVKKGWIKVQQYDQYDALVNTVDAYVHIKSTGGLKFDDNNVKAQIEALVLHSALNEGTLTV